MSAILTPDERAWIRGRHAQALWHNPPRYCFTDLELWPCSTIRCLNALEAAEADIERLHRGQDAAQ